ncbi:NADH-quinone oxidoreductase subunit 1 [bacterium BMS3Abin05]|nr:NADH-quinone oxidoreductase subunit 1 [bacterium BMS3Abin05]GBE26210.1 NADH-quinone oxidoreductase subunit 1 [bacterium BMS3Bbin03]HDZ11391.1 NADH oxidoreductase (quinone) subunit F [Bacteroidota bacterium]
MHELYFLKNRDNPESHTIEFYLGHGGYEALKKTLKQFAPKEVIEEVKKSGLRGRGGAGFPTGIKWGFVPQDNPNPKYLICNADESEPGTFKDRYIIEHEPHMMIEGIVLSSYAINCHQAYIYIRGEFVAGADILEKALAEARAKGFVGKNIFGSGYDLNINVHRGGGAYICGEETGLIESLEGKRGWPRLKPPFPAIVGLFNSPTIINNVETLANVPLIMERGADWYSKIGSNPKNAGPKLYCVSGHVNHPGLFEFPLGMNLKELIYEHAGGVYKAHQLKAVIPGGSSTPVLLPDEIDVAMDYDSLMSIGTMLGSAGAIVMDETTCMVDALYNLERFYAHESCGQCTPCREGTMWMVKLLSRLEHGEGTVDDVDLLKDVAGNIMGRTICPLGDAAAMPAKSFVQKFRDEFIEHTRQHRCPITKDKSIKGTDANA